MKLLDISSALIQSWIIFVQSGLKGRLMVLDLSRNFSIMLRKLRNMDSHSVFGLAGPVCVPGRMVTLYSLYIQIDEFFTKNAN